VSEGTYAFRPLTREDFALLASWLRQPHVARWWNHETDPAAIERDFGATVDGLEPNEDLLVLRDGEPIGLVQRSRLRDSPAYLAEFAAVVTVPDGAVTIDYLLGEPTTIGRGIGTAMIRAVVDDSWRRFPDAPAVVVAVVATNVASWLALERAGFTRVGEGEMEPDNPIDDPAHHVYRVDRPAPPTVSME